MISKTFDWLRTTEIQPSNEDVETQNAIVTSLLAGLDKEKDVDSLLSLVAAASGGIAPEVTTDQKYGQSLIEVTREHRPAVSSNLNENALELRITCLISLGEFLTRTPAKGAWLQAKPLAGLLFLSGNGLRSSEGSHLEAIRDEIANAASGVVQKKAARVRTRTNVTAESFNEVTEPTDLTTFWTELKPILASCMDTIQQAAKADRDELEVLWWLYGRFSETHGKPITKLTSFEAAIATASELVDRSLTPAHPSLRTMIVDATVSGRSKASVKPKELNAIVSKWRENDMMLLGPTTNNVTDFSRDFPKLLPLSWLAVKCMESGVNTGWESEFEMKSRLDAKLSVSPELIASQAFTERAAQRLLATFA